MVDNQLNLFLILTRDMSRRLTSPPYLISITNFSKITKTMNKHALLYHSQVFRIPPRYINFYIYFSPDHLKLKVLADFRFVLSFYKYTHIFILFFSHLSIFHIYKYIYIIKYVVVYMFNGMGV